MKNQLPKTLLELSGVKRPAFDLSQSIVVVIDVQEEYRKGLLPLPDFNAASEAIKQVLILARKEKAPIVHVWHKGTPGGLFDPEGPGFKVVDGLGPRPDEKVVLKTLPDAFAGTDLEKILLQYGKTKTLILVGFMTHMCITNTAVTALNLGFQTAVVKEAVATRDLLGPNGEIVEAAKAQQASLAGLQDRMAWIVQTNELRGTIL